MIGGLIFIYFVGKAFYELAHKYNKNRWGFAVLGVVSYYIGLILGGIMVAIIAEVISPGFVDETSDVVLGLMSVPFGVLVCWRHYTLLKKLWSKPKEVNTQTLDGGLIDTDSN